MPPMKLTLYGNNATKVVISLDKIQELENQYKQILDQMVYGCDIDAKHQKIKRCNKCSYNLGFDAAHKVICLQELEQHNK